MKRVLVLLFFVPTLLNAQRWHVNLFGGFSNYTGDLQSKFFTMDQSYFAFSAGAQYDLTPKISVLSNLTLAQVGASDVYNKPSLQFRNLSFRSKVYELNLLLEYNFLDITESRFTPYIFAGIAGYHFDPYAFDSTGRKYYLKPLSTEGEGLAEYPDRKPYALLQMSIPFGAGIKLRISDGVVIAYEVNFRKLFTDYLDDVSTQYVDETTLLNARGPKAVELAYRGGELKGGDRTYPVGNTKRGSANAMDWYYTSGIRINITINPKKGNYGRGSTECPPKKI